MRSLLVQGRTASCGEGAPESDLRDWGRSKLGSGGKNAKRRTVVAVARKLAVLLHTLWANGQVYDPLYNRKAIQAAPGPKPREKAKLRRSHCMRTGMKFC